MKKVKAERRECIIDFIIKAAGVATVVVSVVWLLTQIFDFN